MRVCELIERLKKEDQLAEVRLVREAPSGYFSKNKELIRVQGDRIVDTYVYLFEPKEIEKEEE